MWINSDVTIFDHEVDHRLIFFLYFKNIITTDMGKHTCTCLRLKFFSDKIPEICLFYWQTSPPEHLSIQPFTFQWRRIWKISIIQIYHEGLNEQNNIIIFLLFKIYTAKNPTPGCNWFIPIFF